MKLDVRKVLRILFFGLMMLLLTHSSTDEEDNISGKKSVRVVVSE